MDQCFTRGHGINKEFFMSYKVREYSTKYFILHALNIKIIPLLPF